MALQRQPFTVNFAQGLDTKTDKYQVEAGKFLDLKNQIFDTVGQLRKRDGFGSLPDLPDTDATTLTTFRESLVAVGSSVSHLSQDNSTWINRGPIRPIDMTVSSVVRGSDSESSPDFAKAPNGLGCVSYVSSNGLCYYKVFDISTSQSVVTASLPSGASLPRVCLLGNYFVVTYMITISAVVHLQYIAIPYSTPLIPGTATDISTVVNSSLCYDIVSVGSNMYAAFNGSDVGGAVRIAGIDQALNPMTPYVIAGASASLISLSSDTTGNSPLIWVTYYSSGNASTAVLSQQIQPVLLPTSVFTGVTINGLTSVVNNQTLNLIYQISNTYSFSSVRSDYLATKTVTQAGVVGTQSVLVRSVGLGSKAFNYNGSIYVVISYGGAFQPTYFLYSFSSGVIAKFAYSNGGGYAATQVLSSVVLDGSEVLFSYLFKDLLVSVNKEQGVTSVGGTYSQTGINIARFTFDPTLETREIANNLHLTGGFMWLYDGDRPVEHGFHLWPEDLGGTTSTTGGTMSAQEYDYIATYEWTDAQGNIHRSAPSLPFKVTTTGATSSVTVNVPTLRLTRKTASNQIRICLYRWSAAQQNYYLTTSITSPLLNDTTVDSVSFVDTKPDSAILGNPLVYTTGGVLENISPSAISSMALSKSRLWAVSSEDENLVYYSKIVVPGVPVEMSDLQSIYINETLAPAGNSRKGTVLAPMDDKIVFMKSGELYYTAGSGPDSTGNNNDFGDPVLITSAVGCSNSKSIAYTPTGIMFQSPSKGIWLLGRDLSTTYVGAPVEKYNDILVTSSLAIPGTNQIRFTLESGITLVFDYMMNQWATFENVDAITSCIYQGKHTYLNSRRETLQEVPDVYLDRTTPVLMGFTTAWIKLAGLQGFQRFYEMNLLGEYKSPHILAVSFAYDYDPSIVQTVLIYPDNYSGPYGSDPLYGSSILYGGNPRVEDWQIYPERQKCESFQITVQEIFDPSFGEVAGAGLTLSGLNLVVGLKKGYRPTTKTA